MGIDQTQKPEELAKSHDWKLDKGGLIRLKAKGHHRKKKDERRKTDC